MDKSSSLTVLIEEVCKDSAEAYDRLSQCLENKTDLQGNPQSSSQWIADIIDRLVFHARRGNSPAMVFLGNAYLKGWGVAPNISKAAEYAKRAASLGDAGGEVLLGFLYANGYGVTADYKRALYWFDKAIQKGHGMAINNMGVMYEQGLGVKKDIKLALKYYQQAAAQKNPLAMKNLERLIQAQRT